MGEQVRLCEPDVRLREGKGKCVFDAASSASLLHSPSRRGVFPKSRVRTEELYSEIWCRPRNGTRPAAMASRLVASTSDGIEACSYSPKYRGLNPR